jgi:hypothetical protein
VRSGGRISKGTGVEDDLQRTIGKHIAVHARDCFGIVSAACTGRCCVSCCVWRTGRRAYSSVTLEPAKNEMR